MLLVEPFFQGFTTKPVSDAHQATEVLIALSLNSRAEVEELMRKALAAGATAAPGPHDHGYMFQHGFADLDGHQWEVFWMDEAAAPAQM
jgi:predicted lactoylglutathione lyase